MFSEPTFYLLIPILLSFLFYIYILYPLYISSLSPIPAIHPTSHISSIWIRRHRRGGRTAFRLVQSAHERLGPIILISPNELSVASIEGLRKIYLGGFEKTEWYVEEFANYGTPNLVSTLSSAPHAAQKRLLSHVYSKSYVQNSEDLGELSRVVLGRWADSLGRMRMKGEGREGLDRDVDIHALEWNSILGADFTTAYLFGLGNGSDFLRDGEAAGRFMGNWRRKIKGLGAEKEKATQEVEAFVLDLIQRTEWSLRNRKDGNEQTKPVVYEQLSNGLEKRNLRSFEDTELLLASEMLDHFGAGMETARIALTYLQWELSRRPELQTALRRELLTLDPPFKFKPSDFQSESRQPLPDPKAVDALPILDAILKETLRLYPPSPGLLTRVVPKGGTAIEGYQIPEGVIVGTSGYVMHMNEDVFPDPKSFKPERWHVEPSQKAEMNRWFWVFGSGRRICIGSHFAIYSKLASRPLEIRS